MPQAMDQVLDIHSVQRSACACACARACACACAPACVYRSHSPQAKDQVLDIHRVQLSVQLSAMDLDMDLGMLEDFIEATQGVRQNDLHTAMQERFAPPATPGTQEAAPTGERVDFWEKFCVESISSDENSEDAKLTSFAPAGASGSSDAKSATVTLPAASPAGKASSSAPTPSEFLELISAEVALMQVEIDSGVHSKYCRV